MIHRIIVEIETKDDGKESGLEGIVNTLYDQVTKNLVKESEYIVHDVYFEGGSSATGLH